tara:strand:- start:3990 stop:4424 length:435 start_codon:yes stop_codon:yes gene_type:complete
MLKLKLELHQPKKWDKTPYVTQDEVDQYEYLIYNDLSISKKLDRDIPKYTFEWVDKFLVENEEYRQLEGDINTYCITSFGRIFSSGRKKSVKPIKVRNNFYITLKGESIVFRKEFFKYDWTYSPSVILGNYKKYGWKYYEPKPE